MLHGLSFDHQLLKGLFEPLYNRYQRIYISLHGMKQSIACVDIASPDHIQEVLLQSVTSIAQEDVIMIGGSFGGYLTSGVISNVYDRIDSMMFVVFRNYS